MPQEGDIVRNRNTGAMAVWRNGQPVPMDAPGPVFGPAPTPKAPPAPNPGTGYTLNPDGTATFIPGGSADPNATQNQPKPIEGDKRAASFLIRALGANAGFEQTGMAGRNIFAQAFQDASPDLSNELINSAPRQVSDAAQREFVAATLRLDSGAAIPPEELDNQIRLYFPMPGDGEDVIEYKRQARLRAIEGLKMSAGPLREEALSRYAALVDAQGDKPFSFTVTDDSPPRNAREESIALWGPGVFDAQGNPLGPEGGLGYDAEGNELGLFGGATDDSPPDISEARSKDGGALQTVDAAVRGAADVVTLGYADEIAGALDTLFGGGTMSQNLSRQRAIDRFDEANNSGARLTGQLAGGLMLPAGRVNSLRGAAATGAGFGAAYGSGSAEGGITNRLVGAATGGAAGAAGGAAVGAVAPVVGRGVNALARFAPGRRAATGEQNALIAAGQRQQVPIRRADLDPEGMAQRRGVARASEEGNRIIRAADAEDLEATEAAVGRLSPGEASVDTFQTGERAQSVLNRSDKRLRTTAQRFYRIADDASAGKTFKPQGAVSVLDEEIARLQGEGADPAIINYLTRQSKELARPEGWTAMQLHAKRAGIRKNMSAAGLPPDADDLPMIRALDAASQDLRTALADNPKALRAVERADELWRERGQLREEVTNRLLGRRREFTPDQTGRALASMVKSDSNRLARLVNEMTPEERADFGADIASQLGRDGQGNFSLARFLTQTEGKGAIATPRSMRLIFGEDGAKAIADLRAIAKAKQAAASETNYSKTGNVVSSAGRGLRTLLFAGFGATTGGAAGAVVAPAASSWVSRVGERRAARMLTNPDFTKWLRAAPDTNKPAAIDRYFGRLSSLAARSPALAADVESFKRALVSAANDNAPSRLAAEPQDASEPGQVQ